MTSSPASPVPAAPPTWAGSGSWLAAAGCAVGGGMVFLLYGNANHGYIDTASLYWWWAYQWINPRSETQHGWLILALSGWLLWRNLRVGVSPELAPSGAGGRWFAAPALAAPLVAMLAGLALHAVGFAAQQARVSILALLLFLWGVLRLGGGPRWGRAAAFPVAFLVFALPLNALDSLGFWLRVWVVNAGAAVAHAAGIDVRQSGTQLFAPDGRFNYDVVAACSGVRSLLALAALSLLLGYLSFRAWWRRGLLLLLAFPLVYVGNVVRILAIVVAAEVGGEAWGNRIHVVMGYGVFVIVLGGVWGVAAWLQRSRPERPRAPAPGAAGAVGARVSGRGAGWVVAGVVITLALTEGVLLHRLATRPALGRAGVALAADGLNPVELPVILGRDWVGRPAAVSAVERDILPPDTGYSRMEYVAPRDGRRVFLSIVLSGRDRTSIHRPELCLVGQGWTIRGRATHLFRHPQRPGGPIPASLLRVDRQQPTSTGPVVVPQLVAYWFVGGDAEVPTAWERMARDGWNRVFRARADRWAYVLLLTDATDGEEAALGRMQSVLERTLPVFAPMPVGGVRVGRPAGR
ncbi:exosortase/archaeosortase family protein [Opitutus sp. ER46]|uniref:exosortase/archaeosortase family protein n=1 Tax=Opitutus sp. ER46 TaxID=2161864 RepID=UPI001304CC3E|nr:exosortase/archaeosortase family protein [Opitutus sp. ER46]